MSKKKRLLDAYHFSGFRRRATVKGIFGDSKARIIGLERRQKKQCVDVAERHIGVSTIGRNVAYGICPVATCESTWRWKSGGCCAEGAER